MADTKVSDLTLEATPTGDDIVYLVDDPASGKNARRATLTSIVALANTRTDEEIEDLIGAMTTGNTESLITVTYQDADGTFDFTVDNDLANYSNATSGFAVASTLASTTNGNGASLIGVEDSAGNYTATNLEAVLTEINGRFATTDTVGISTSQTLTNKTISGDDNTISNLAIGSEVSNTVGANILFSADSTYNIGEDAVRVAHIYADSITVTDDIDATGVATVTPASGDFFLMLDTSDSNNLKRVDFDDLPGAGGGISNIVEDTTPQLGGQLDVNGNAIGDGTNELLTFTETASAVNNVGLTNAATGNAPSVNAVGDDTNVDLVLSAKGTGVVKGHNEAILLAVSDETTALTTGTSKLTFRMPYAFTLEDVRASVTTAPTGSVVTVDINEGGTSILSTKLTIDDGEKTSTTAATAAVISDADLADDAEVTIDIDTVGSGVAGTGLKISLIGYQS